MVNDFRRVVRPDSIDFRFDDEGLVSDAGLLLPATLAERLGVKELIEERVDLGDRPGAANPGVKALSVIHGMLAGADSIDDLNILRSGSTERVLGHRVLAPSTLGIFLRDFTFGHVRQLEAAAAEILKRCWKTGAGPGTGRLTVDVDSFIGQVHGHKKQGAAFGYTRERGYHPLLATRAETGEVLGMRLRTGSANTQRGIDHFLRGLIKKARRAGAGGEILIRADSGFWRTKTFELLEEKEIRYSITVRGNDPRIARTIAGIPESAWEKLDGYPEPGLAEIAETVHGERRMIVRRVRELSAQQELLPGWRHHPFITNRDEEIFLVEAEHRQHAVIELSIRDLKAGALTHFPSGSFSANSAWTQLAALAHNLARWSWMIATPGRSPRTLETFQRRLIRIPGRLVCSGRRTILRLPARWPWRDAFTEALQRIRLLSRLT